MKKYLLALLLLIAVSILTFLALPKQIPFSPLGTATNSYTASSPNHVILGFAPYWNMKKLTDESLSSVTHFAYFALHLRGDGSLLNRINPREEDPGYTNYQRLLANPPQTGPLILTFMQEDQESLVNMLSSTESRKNAINTILVAVKESKASGVNIDLEPTGDISQTLRDNFTSFISELNTQLSTLNDILITISIYPSAAAKPRLWDLNKLNLLTDYFVVMTYDYTMPKSKSAGPNSPLRDFGGEFEHNILKNLGELTSFVSPSKILLGIPLYGYQWDTIDASRYSPTESRGVTASLERIEAMIQDKTLELVWDRNSLTPYGVSTSSGSTSQIYFENEASIRLKLEVVRSAGLGGIALWALGYDNNVSWLWPTLKTL